MAEASDTRDWIAGRWHFGAHWVWRMRVGDMEMGGEWFWTIRAGALGLVLGNVAISGTANRVRIFLFEHAGNQPGNLHG